LRAEPSGCDVGQGFLLGRPGPALAIEDLIRGRPEAASAALASNP
jgi:EAL domain-containing protein (putative c-di-GMP-specific phosphodiesterase class I)